MEIGDVVKSLKGRDTGRVFVVCELVDNNFVNLVNGDTRKHENKKRKRLKHIEVIGHTQVLNKQNLLDADIKKVCKTYLNGGKDA